MTGLGFLLGLRRDADTGSWASTFIRAGGVGGRCLLLSDGSPASRSGGFTSTVPRPMLGEGNAAFSQAKVEANLEGEVSYVTTGLIVRGGVIGRSPALSPFFLLKTAGCFLTGSDSSSFRSNNDTRAFVGPIELESVVGSRSTTEWAVLSSPTYPFRCSRAGWWVFDCTEGAVLGLGLADRLAASVAAMRDGERGSPVADFAGVNR